MASDADLVLSTLRHQRDLFSGPLGIPDVTTRVGSVIHAFETMARQRQSLGSGRTEKPYDATATIGGGNSKYRSHRSNVKRVGADTVNRHKIILPSPNLSPTSSAEVNDPSNASGGHYLPLHLSAGPEGISQSNFPSQQHQYHLASSTPHHPHPLHHHHHHLPPSSFSYTDPHGTGLRRHTTAGGASGRLMGGVGGDTHIENNNSEHSSVQPGHHHGQTIPRGLAVFPSSAFGHHGHSNTTGMAAAAAATSAVTVGGAGSPQPQHYQPGNENESSNFDSLNLDDDYRKSSFGKQSKLLQLQQQQQQRQPSSSSLADTMPSVARNQFTGGASGTDRPTNRGLWSLFGGTKGPPVLEHASHATSGYSSSRNNPNVFFNASNSSSSPTITSIPSAVVTTSPPMATTSTTTTTATTTTTSNGSTTMRYYNLDNTNGANRRSTMVHPNHRSSAGEQQPQQESQFLPDSLDDTLVSVQRYGEFDADNELDDGQATASGNTGAGGDKFLRGSTVSQSFIKNVRIMRKKSSSYDVNTPNGTSGTGTSHMAATALRGSQRGKEQVGSMTTTNSFKQRGSQMMAAAAKHFTKRNRAPSVPTSGGVTPSPLAGTAADNDGLTGSVRPADDGIDEPVRAGEVDRSNEVSPAATGQSAPRAGSGKRRLFQPRTMDRAEI
ncbi:uncharacterized protein DDB_G0271670-like [Anopheles aquasalis]|uniref:uncharacterized protein DDB_G0271670-like n=1 Tax=Anopheles aquasalis TaxID=42839 RepID=UPI00215A4741|nr:uncharacterized protein DDB_G0271670-like [Anopheles aquasalis]